MRAGRGWFPKSLAGRGAIVVAVLAGIVLGAPQGHGLALVSAATVAMAMFPLMLAVMRRARAVPWQGLRLRVARRKAEPAFETLPVPLMRFAIDGRVIAANAAARSLIGDRNGGYGFAHDLFEDMGRPVAEWVRDVALSRHPGGSEMLRLRRTDDAESYVQMTAQRLGEAEVLAVLQDATAMKRLEAQFTQSQKMQVIGQLAGGIAHDFNNLLTAITGHCDLLLLRHQPDDLDHADLQQIQQNAYRAGALVRQLLAFSRKQTMVPEDMDLTEVLGELTHLLNRLLGGAVRLDLHHAPVAVALRADKRQFEQVIVNLAVNARDAMPMGGVLKIATDLVTLDTGLHRDRAVVPPGKYAVIHVSDSGTGIAPEVMEKIFEPFFTTKRAGEGTGLGLSTVYGIVKQSGGYVFVASTPGEGTEFQLWFPASTAATAPKPAPPATPRRQAAAEGVVLLVEDEAPVRAFAARALRLRGLTVLEADSGEQALVVAGATAGIDLIISDMVLPGLDGPAWVRKALERRQGTPVIFMSGYAAEAPSEAQARIENSAFLAKPFTLAELSELVALRLSSRDRPQAVDALSVS